MKNNKSAFWNRIAEYTPLLNSGPLLAKERIVSNRRVWNGIMWYFCVINGHQEKFQKEFKDAEKLSNDKIHTIITNLQAEGYDLKSSNNPMEGIKFTGFEFGKVSFNGLLFPYHVSFDHCTFKHDVSFHNAKFFSSISFSHARFKGKAIFSRSIFNGAAIFDYVEAEGVLNFNRSGFKERSSFVGIKCKKRFSFRRVYSSKVMFFSTAKFFNLVDFSHCDFQSDIHFVSAVFSSQAIFKECRTFAFLNFECAKFEGELILQDAEFKDAPNFNGASIMQNSIWDGCKWPSNPAKKESANEFAKRYAVLTHLMAEKKDEKNMRIFHLLQMKSSRINDDWISRIIGHIYEAISDYGENFRRVFFWWIGNIAFIAIGIYLFVVRRNPAVFYSFDSKLLNSINEIGLSLLYSLSLCLPFLGLNGRIKTDIEKLLIEENIGSFSYNVFRLFGVIELFVGSVLFFFLILSIRNKFKLK